VVPVQVVRQPRLFIKHLPRIPQVELHRLCIAGAAGRGQVDDFRAVALACGRCAIGTALVGVLAQHGAAYAVFGVQGLHGDGLARSARIALEHALAQGVVDVADGLCIGSVCVFAGLGDAAVRAVVQVVVALLDQVPDARALL
jgi:hypothetical protein